MGSDNKIEFTGGTLYFAPLYGDGGVVSTLDALSYINMETNAVEAAEVPVYVNKTVNTLIEFEGTCQVTFRARVLLFGFWPAVRWTVRSWWRKIKQLWKDLRTPIYDLEA